MISIPLLFPGHPGISNGDYVKQAPGAHNFRLPSAYHPLQRIALNHVDGFRTGPSHIYGPVLQVHDDTRRMYGILSVQIPIPEKDWEGIRNPFAQRTIWIPICQKVSAG